VTLANKIKKYKMKAHIDFLHKEEDLGLDNDDFEIIRKRKIMGRDFLKTSKEEFEHYGLEMGLAKRLANFAKECKDKKLKAFSSYLSLSEVLAEYGFDSDAMQNKYVIAFLYASIHIIIDITDKKLSMRPHYLIGDRLVPDFLLFDLCEDLICITEDKQHKVPVGIAQNIKQLKSACETNRIKRNPRKISKVSDTAYSIEFIKKALDPNSEEYQSLYKNVKKVLGIIVSLLKDRAYAEEEPKRKRVKIEGYCSKK
ncbi:hypothetical protein RhiirC2_763856, partial [Rhizophagus irregularis]